MKDAITQDSELTQAGPETPDVATCPACGGQVVKRKRRSRDNTTWYYRHAKGEGLTCSRRFYPNG